MPTSESIAIVCLVTTRCIKCGNDIPKGVTGIFHPSAGMSHETCLHNRDTVSIAYKLDPPTEEKS